jgi:hypothetical protein
MNVGPMTFHELYSRYAEDVYRFAHWLSGNPEVARDSLNRKKPIQKNFRKHLTWRAGSPNFPFVIGP